MTAPGNGPHEGLRGGARSPDLLPERPRVPGAVRERLSQPLGSFELWEDFEVERYLRYHGEKLARRRREQLASS